MLLRFHLLGLALAGCLWLGAGPVGAEVVHFHYVPKDACGNTALVPGPNGAPGERSPWLGGPKEPFTRLPAPTHMVTFRHPASNQNVIVPVTFPQGTPRIETRSIFPHLLKSGSAGCFRWVGIAVPAPDSTTDFV